MMYTASTITSIIAPGTTLLQPEARIEYLLTDSRAVLFPSSTLFFALSGFTKNGAQFLPHLYSMGVRNFVVTEPPPLPMEEAQFYVVPDVLAALQQLAAHHRAQFDIPVIGITGSNGKTIVKEWLYQLLQNDYSIVRSPKSYNSQVGVPLSVWQIAPHHTLAIIEAGISQEGEMDRLNKVIRPTIGVLTNIGTAHDEGFTSEAHKRDEKLKLFKGAERFIGEEAHIAQVRGAGSPFTWGSSSTCTLQVLRVKYDQSSAVMSLRLGSWNGSFTIPFSDEASVENVITCISVLFSLGFDAEAISGRLPLLHAVDMRLQLKEGMNQCTIINDSYSADLTSLNIALHFLAQQHSGKERVVILSDFAESGKRDEVLYALISDALGKNKVQRVVAIGERITEHLPKSLPPSIGIDLFQSTESFLQGRGASSFRDATILIKGARKFGFERIAQAFEKKVHQTVLQIDLNALAHNLKEYRKLIPAKTKVMAMVKAFGYGSGSAEIAAMLQFNNVDYLGVAYADEGVSLRKAGVEVPIMVLNTDEASFPALVNFNLQPVIYAQSILEAFTAYLAEQGIALFPVHIEIETGMNRLGFLPSEIAALAEYLLTNPAVKVESVFSHLAASEDAMHDAFTEKQAEIFRQAVAHLRGQMSTPFLE
ncbi:MAG TPA: alanine racemase, partial [Flavisolibacter sp.]|nr:alanine racemase [Flavisolibacter sp.]